MLVLSAVSFSRIPALPSRSRCTCFCARAFCPQVFDDFVMNQRSSARRRLVRPPRYRVSPFHGMATVAWFPPLFAILSASTHQWDVPRASFFAVYHSDVVGTRSCRCTMRRLSKRTIGVGEMFESGSTLASAHGVDAGLSLSLLLLRALDFVKETIVIRVEHGQRKARLSWRCRCWRDASRCGAGTGIERMPGLAAAGFKPLCIPISPPGEQANDTGGRLQLESNYNLPGRLIYPIVYMC